MSMHARARWNDQLVEGRKRLCRHRGRQPWHAKRHRTFRSRRSSSAIQFQRRSQEVCVSRQSVEPQTHWLNHRNAEVCIGREYTSNPQPFNGLIDEVEVFDRALSAEEIAALYNAGSAGKCRTCTSAPGGMDGWWPDNGNTNDVIGGNNGT